MHTASHPSPNLPISMLLLKHTTQPITICELPSQRAIPAVARRPGPWRPIQENPPGNRNVKSPLSPHFE
jgi:hypothetical protein